MSHFRAINARPIINCADLDTGVDQFSSEETKADNDTSNDNNNAEANSSPDPGVNYIDSSGIDASDPDGDQSLPSTPDTDPVTTRVTHTTTANTTAGNHDNSATAVPVDSRCEAVARCRAGSGDHRKTVSHIFGRNKAATRGIPEDCWIKWCRKHYQRFTYRDSLAGNWHKHQLGLVREQIDRFENRTNVTSWKIALRKKEQGKLDIENAAIAAGQITLTAPSTAPNPFANSTGVSPTRTSCVTAAASTAVATGLAESTTPTTKSTSTFTEIAPSSADAALRPITTAGHGINTSATFDAPAAVAPNTSNISNTTIVTPDTATIHHFETLSTAPSDADDDVDTDANSTPAPPAPQLWERFLVPYLGMRKSFVDVRTVCDAIEREFATPAFQARDTDKKAFPGVEFLPTFPDPKFTMRKIKVTTSTTKSTKRKAEDTKTAGPPAPSKRPRLVRGAKT